MPAMDNHPTQRNLAYYFPVIVFIVSLLTNLQYFNWQAAPLLPPDSGSYIQFAENLSQFKVPYFFSRTPTYPLYLLIFFKNLTLVVLSQTVLSALSNVLIYLIGLKLIKQPLLIFSIVAIILTDPFVASFNSYILTECLSTFLLMLSLYLHIRILTEGFNRRIFVFSIISDIFLMFARPNLFLLPSAILAGTLLYYFIYNRTSQDLKKITLFASAGIFLNIFMVLSWCALNLIQNDRFAVSNVGDINLLGKLELYGMVRENDKSIAIPESAQKVLEIQNRLDTRRVDTFETPGMIDFRYRSLCNRIIDCPKSVRRKFIAMPGLVKYMSEDIGNIDPYTVYNELSVENQLRLNEANKYFLVGNGKEYFLKSIRATPRVMMDPRRFSTELPRYITNDAAISRIGFFFQLIALTTPVTLSLSLIAFFRFLFHKDRQKVAVLGTILLTTFYVIFGLAFMSYSDYSRLRMPVVPIIEFTSLLIIMLTIKEVASFIAIPFWKRSPI